LTDLDVQTTCESSSVEATLALGAALGRGLMGGLTIGIVGPLGAGKTHLVKGIAAGNGTTDPREVTSPTFTLIQEYSGRLRLFHVDAYRLRGSSELVALGFDELVTDDSVVVMEWADRVRTAMPSDALWIEITPMGEFARRLDFHARGGLAKQCMSIVQTQQR